MPILIIDQCAVRRPANSCGLVSVHYDSGKSLLLVGHSRLHWVSPAGNYFCRSRRLLPLPGSTWFRGLSFWLVAASRRQPVDLRCSRLSFCPRSFSAIFLVESIPSSRTGARGVFVSIIVGFLSVSIFDLLSRRTIIRMLEGVPTSERLRLVLWFRWRLHVCPVWAISVLFALYPFGEMCKVYLHLFHVADALTMPYGTVGLGDCLHHSGIFWSLWH